MKYYILQRPVKYDWVAVAGFVFVMTLMGGCSSSDQAIQPGADELFERGMAKFKNEDYLDAYDDFRLLTLQYQGSAHADDAQFYMGECQYQRGEYIVAAYEYETLIRTMPTSEFATNAQFQVALCYYNRSPDYFLDQEYTRKAIDAFQAFLEYHPTDERAPQAEAYINELNTKLAHKEFENGIIYMKMTYYRAATVSFDFVLEKYHDTEYAEPALLKKAEALMARKRFRDARDVASNFLDKYPSSSLRKEAETVFQQAQSGLQNEQQQKKPGPQGPGAS